MRLIVTGGGTGGHLFPGIAVAEAMKRRIAETRLLFVGTSRLLDQQALYGRGYEVKTLACSGVKGLSLGRKIGSLLQLPFAVLAARRIIGDFHPQLVFGVGGYVTGPVLLAARSMRIPVAIHEQNSVPGLANRLAGKLADTICISLPCKPSFPPEKTVLTGNPVRQEIIEAAAKNKEKEAGGSHTVLVLGGSQGAHRVNILMLEAMERLQANGLAIRIIHQTGQDDQEMVTARYRELGVQAEVAAFITDMASAYLRADLVISRAGATTLAELAVMGLPAVLIPFPFAADNHQVTNGEYYTNGGGCMMLEQSGLSGEILSRVISERLHNPQELHTMAAKMRVLAMPDAADRIVDQLCGLVPESNRKSTKKSQ